MRVIPIVLCLPALLCAQDAREIVRRACDLETRNADIVRNYTYLLRQDESDLDGSGNIKNRRLQTWDVTWLEGSPYRKLVARNDQPLSREEQQQEQEKMRRDLDQRRAETPEQRRRRIAEWERRERRRQDPVKELPDAFNFRIAGQEPLNGEDTWIIDATPKPGYKPRSTQTVFFPKVKARLWIGKNDHQWVKLDMETIDTVTLGGFLVRIAKGSHLVLEQQRVNKEIWMPKRVSVRASARVLFVKSYRKNIEMVYSDYRKFQAQSRVVDTRAAGEKP